MVSKLVSGMNPPSCLTLAKRKSTLTYLSLRALVTSNMIPQDSRDFIEDDSFQVNLNNVSTVVRVERSTVLTRSSNALVT